jgi:septal ring factor EnvC (AmiA/AmiB activator)
MYNDSTLTGLENERDAIIKRQAEMAIEVETTRKRQRDEIDRINRDWGGKVARLESMIEADRSKLPSLMSKIERRKAELAHIEETNRKKLEAKK